MSNLKVYNKDIHPVILGRHLASGWSFSHFCGHFLIKEDRAREWLYEHVEFLEVYVRHYGKRSRKMRLLYETMVMENRINNDAISGQS